MSESESDPHKKRTKRKHDSMCESESKSESMPDDVDEAEFKLEGRRDNDDDEAESQSESEPEGQQQRLITLEHDTQKTMEESISSNILELERMAYCCSSGARFSPDKNIKISSAQKICESTSVSRANDLKKRKHQEIESEDVDEANNKQSWSLFQKKFSPKDEKKILRALLKTVCMSATKEFWSIAHDSLQLSIPMTQFQVCRTARMPKENYMKRLRRSNGNLALSLHGRRLHKLSDKIWGNEAKAKATKYEKKLQSVDFKANEMRMDVDKIDKLLSRLRNSNYLCNGFPVAKTLDAISDLKSSELRKKWDDLLVSQVEIFLRTRDLIQETVEAANAS